MRKRASLRTRSLWCAKHIVNCDGVQTIGGGKGGACVMPARKAATLAKGASCSHAWLAMRDSSVGAQQCIPQPALQQPA
jgi:hypothetical protein